MHIVYYSEYSSASHIYYIIHAHLYCYQVNYSIILFYYGHYASARDKIIINIIFVFNAK